MTGARADTYFEGEPAFNVVWKLIVDKTYERVSCDRVGEKSFRTNDKISVEQRFVEINVSTL